ncbi:MAG: DUF5615 family PIN-like protein [Dolichospermum lemmermannii FEM_B0920]
MIERIKFHLDESVSNAIALGLHRRGINVTTTSETGLMGVSDREQIAFALSENYIQVYKFKFCIKYYTEFWC